MPTRSSTQTKTAPLVKRLAHRTYRAFERHRLAMPKDGTTIQIKPLSSGNAFLTADFTNTPSQLTPTCNSSGRHLSATSYRNFPKHKPSQLPLTTPLQNQLRSI